MEKIIAEELEVLKRLLEKIYEKVPSLEEADRNGFEACRTTMCRINERYAEFVDDAIRHAKAERKKEGIVIERRNDPRTYLTLNGEMTFNHTYYALADGTFFPDGDELDPKMPGKGDPRNRSGADRRPAHRRG